MRGGREETHSSHMAPYMLRTPCRRSACVLCADEVVDDVRRGRVAERVAEPLGADDALDDRRGRVDATVAGIQVSKWLQVGTAHSARTCRRKLDRAVVKILVDSPANRMGVSVAVGDWVRVVVVRNGETGKVDRGRIVCQGREKEKESLFGRALQWHLTPPSNGRVASVLEVTLQVTDHMFWSQRGQPSGLSASSHSRWKVTVSDNHPPALYSSLRRLFSYCHLSCS
jgi:hypothetical protein